MSAAPTDVEVGDELPAVEQEANLATAVRYAGASGDFNPLHFDEGFAAEISPTGGIIAHGMFSMGLASRVVTEWAGGPDRVADVDVRFTRPWPLDTTATFTGVVTDIDDDVAHVRLRAETEDGDRILRGTAKVRL